MNIYKEQQLDLRQSIIVIGAFDGVHVGHQTLIRQAKKEAVEKNVPLVVYTFDVSPRVYFQQVQPLMSIETKLDKMDQLGVDYVVLATFNKEYANRSQFVFIDELERMNPYQVWVGYDFKFGRDRSGNIQTLQKNFSVRVLEPVCCKGGETISSTRIRKLFTYGRYGEATELLGWGSMYEPPLNYATT